MKIFIFQLFFNSTVPKIIFIRYCLDAIFILNIISRFYIGYERHGVVITDSEQVRWKYLRSWFTVDLLSVLPLETLRYAFPVMHFMQISRCLRVLRLFNIISSFSNEPDTNKIHVAVLKSFSIIVISVQVSTCLWFYQVCDAAYEGHPRYCPKRQNWLNLLPECKYGEIHAMNEREVIVAAAVMVLGLVAFLGVVVTGMSSIISNLDTRRGRFCHRMDSICLYMKYMGLPEDIQTWVQKYYDYLWIYRKGSNVAGLFDDLPFALHSDVSSVCYTPLVKKSKLFQGTDIGFQRALSLKFNTQTFSPGQILARPGEINHSAYYIEHGLVEVFGEDPNDKIATLLPGSSFGEVYLMYKIPRNTTICAATLCEITILEKSNLITLLADYPKAAMMITRAAKTHLHNVKHAIREAFALGVASNPQNVVFHKDLSVNLKARDHKIFTSFMESTNKVMHCFWKKTIQPDSAFAKIWEVFLFWSVTVSIFIETWVLFFTNNVETTGFLNEGWGAFYLAISCVVDLVAIADIFVTLRTEVITKDGCLSDLSELFEHYRASWNLYYDVLAVLPLDWISFSEDGTGHWQLLSYVRMNKLIWLRKVYLYFNKKENDMKQNTYEQRAAKCIFLLIFSVHFCAGLLYASACNTFRCDENSWAWNAGLKTAKSNFYHYMYAAYFSTTTMTTVGYGDIVPITVKERLAAATVAIVGLFVFNYIISQVYATLASKNATRVAFQNLLSAMSLLMEQEDMSISLQNRITEYMSLLWTKYQGEAHPRGPFIMHDLPVELQQIVLVKERGKLLSKIPYFEQAGQPFIGDLASSSVIYYFPRGEIIQYSETITRELFCIRRGTCQVLNDELSEILGLYGKGMYFGEAGFLFGKQALMTVRAKTYCEILVIDFEKVRCVLERYPGVKSQIEELQTKSEYYYSLVRTVEKMMKKTCKKLEEANVTQENKDVSFTYQGPLYSKKSKCYIEDFGNFPIYAGAEEETVEEKITTKERFAPFFRSCSSVFLMRNAILPSSQFYIKWEVFRIILSITISIISSTLFAFLHYKIELWIVAYCLGFFCWIDMYIRFHVAFYNGNSLTFDPLETAKHYAKTSLFLDFISCFPWEIIGWMLISPFSHNGFYGNSEVLHLYAYMRVPHILQLYRIPLAFSFQQSGIAKEKAILTFVQFFLLSILFLHFSTCIVFAVACPAANIYGNTSKYLLPLMKHNCTELSWVTHLDHVVSVEYETANFFEIYAVSLYFATATLCGVGYGDILPYVIYMKIIMVFIMIAGALYCGLLSGTVAAMLANADATRAAFTEKKESVKLFLKTQGITGDLYNNTLQFYSFKWIRTKGIDRYTLFEYLPSSLLGDISTVIYADLIAKVAFGLNIKKKLRMQSNDEHLSPLERKLSGKLDQPVFQKTLRKESMDRLETDGGFIRMLATQIQPCLYRANDLICKRNDFGSEMYFIDNGEVDVLSQDERTVIIKLRAGQYFGEGSLLFAEPRATTIRAATNCDLYVLSKKSFDETIKYYPDICKQIMKAAAMKRDQLRQRKEQITNATGLNYDFSPSFSDIKLYKDSMVENEKKAKLKALPLYIQLKIILSQLLMNILDKIITIHNTTIDPENTFRVVYQYTSCLLIIISFWAITYMVSMKHKKQISENTYKIFLQSVLYLQMIEIILKFHICFYNDSGSYISDYKSVSRSYMKRKMGYIFDVVCSFPYALTVLHQMNEMMPMSFLPIFVYARAGHLLRIVTLLVFMWTEEHAITTNLMSIRIIKNLVNTIFFIHCGSVSFVAFVTYFGTNSWVGDLEIYFFPDIYRYAVYWALSTYTTTGYGDVTAYTIGEVIFSILIIIMSTVQVHYNMGLISSTQTNKESLKVAYEEKLQTIQTYMMDQNIPSPLQNRVIQFYNYRWTHTKGIDSEDLFKDLPHSMKAQIFSSINLLKKHQLFSHLSETFLRHLSNKCFLELTHQHIKRRGDRGTGMYLILIGKVKVHSCRPGGEVIEYVSAGAAMDVHLLFKHGLCRDTAIAVNYVDIFFLSKQSFDEIGSYYPNAMDKLVKRSSNILNL
uniref:Cyclic nucleotide-binding domain-containing protein n=1 Tax=Electrophorus electricus TaxID=8005 RepID=A0A4W4EST5_ELEEL